MLAGRDEATAGRDREAVGAGRHGHLKIALAIQLREERIAAQELDQLLLAFGDADARVERLAEARVDHFEFDAAGRVEVREIGNHLAARADLHRHGLALRVSLAGCIEFVVAFR